LTLNELRSVWEVDDIAAKRNVARQYVEAHRERLQVYQKYTRDELVTMVGARRRAGDWGGAVEISAWILTEYEPQHITGRLRPGGA